ncbi:MAG: hypothetical protein N2484_02955 [Clostridia bacterium]|nr:hypothetical protein [Clostridia bacterium]
MDEFRKPYEYEEETGVAGFVFVFAMMLIVFEVFLGVITLAQGHVVAGLFPGASKVYVAVAVLFIAFTLFTFFALYKVHKHALKVVKSYLIFRILYLTPVCVLIFNYSRIAKASANETLGEMIVGALVVPLIYIWGFSILWYGYFLKSKRVKDSY